MITTMSGLLIEQYAKVHQVNAAYQQNAKHDRNNSSHEIYRLCQGMSGLNFRNCISDQLETYYTKQATNEDLKAQKEMALWALWMFAVSLAMAILTAIGVFFVYRTLQATRQTLREAESTTTAALQANVLLREDQRAWMDVNLPDNGAISVKDGKTIFEFTLKAKNIGKSPATLVSVVRRAVRVETGMMDFKDEVELFDENPGWTGVTVFPNKPFVRDLKVELRPIKNFLENNRVIAQAIVGVKYKKFADSRETGLTLFLIQVDDCLIPEEGRYERCYMAEISAHIS